MFERILDRKATVIGIKNTINVNVFSGNSMLHISSQWSVLYQNGLLSTDRCPSSNRSLSESLGDTRSFSWRLPAALLSGRHVFGTFDTNQASAITSLVLLYMARSRRRHSDRVLNSKLHFLRYRFVAVVSGKNTSTESVTGRSRWPRGLRSLGCRDRGFESRWRHGCLSPVFICCVVLYR
jgi:hypothetical protein